jgi:lipopolysaccharide export system permease protein
MLENESLIIFKDYDVLEERFVDAYWIRSFDDILRMKYLYPFKNIPEGEFVDHLQRDSEGKLNVKASQPSQIFPDIHFNSSQLTESLTQPLDLSMSALKDKLPYDSKNLSEKEAQILSVFFYKITIPWLCLLAVIGPAPYCIRFTRQLPIFFIYALSIFGLVAFYLIMDAALILGSRQVLQPSIAIFGPFLLCFGFFSMRYIRITTA